MRDPRKKTRGSDHCFSPARRTRSRELQEKQANVEDKGRGRSNLVSVFDACGGPIGRTGDDDEESDDYLSCRSIVIIYSAIVFPFRPRSDGHCSLPMRIAHMGAERKEEIAKLAGFPHVNKSLSVFVLFRSTILGWGGVGKRRGGRDRRRRQIPVQGSTPSISLLSFPSWKAMTWPLFLSKPPPQRSIGFLR